MPGACGKLWLSMTAPDDGTAVYEIRRARSREELAAALELRHDVFCVEQGVPERDELDGRDHEGIHLVAMREGELLATCRILLVGSTAQFSRLAVRKSARRQGIATALLEAADAEARAGGARRLVLHAQTYARELYEQRRLPRRGDGCSGRPGSSTSRWRSCLIENRRGPRRGTRCLRSGSTR